MAFTAYHNIDGSDGVNVELLARGDNASNIKSILITNTTAGSANVSLYIQDQPSSAVAKTYYLCKDITIPIRSSLLLDDTNMLSFDNSLSGYALHFTIGGSETADILITR